MKLQNLILAAGLVVGVPAIASASPWNVQPDGTITSSGSLAFQYVSRSAGFSHEFGLYDTSHILVASIFNTIGLPAGGTDCPATGDGACPPGSSVAGTWAGTFVFGVYVPATGSTWYSGITDGTTDPVDATQVLKFHYQTLSDYTTRIFIEDLRNVNGNAGSCYHDYYGYTFYEGCDYNDMVVDVTNTPEPATMGLLALGLVGMAGAGALRRRSVKTSPASPKV